MINSDVCYQQLIKLDEEIKEKMTELSDQDGIVVLNIFGNSIKVRLVSNATFFTSEYHNTMGLQRCYIFLDPPRD